MRVLFFTAAALAATLASIGQAIRLESMESSSVYFEDQFPQLNALEDPKPKTGNPAADAATAAAGPKIS